MARHILEGMRKPAVRRTMGVRCLLSFLLALTACGIKGPEATVEGLSEGMSLEEARSHMSEAGWNEVFASANECSQGTGVLEYEYISESGAL